MRTNKELGQVLLDNIDEYFDTGLCDFLRMMKFCKNITVVEFNMLMDLLSLDDRYYIGFFLGEPFDKEPRIKWIKENLMK